MFPRNTIVVCSAVWHNASEPCTMRNAAMHNWNAELALTYHEETKHSYDSVSRGRHFLDWANQPRPFTLYPGLEAIRLPADLPVTQVPAFLDIDAPGETP